MKNLKHFEGLKQQTALRKLFRPPTDKNFLHLWNKIFLRRFTGISRQLLCKCFSKVVIGRLEKVQCKWCFSDTNQKHVRWKIYKVRCLTVLQDFIFIMLNELRSLKWVRFFERNCISKWVIFFASFCWLWDFLPENLKLIKSKYEVLNHLFSEVLNHLFSGPNFVFRRTVLGRFIQCNSKIFLLWPTMVVDIFT